MEIAVTLACALIALFESFAVADFVRAVLRVDRENSENSENAERRKFPIKIIVLSLPLAVAGLICGAYGVHPSVICGFSVIYLFLVIGRRSKKKIIQRIIASVSAVGIAFGAFFSARELLSTALMLDYFDKPEDTMKIPQKLIEASLLWLFFDMLKKFFDRDKVRFRRRNWIQIIVIFGCSILAMCALDLWARTDHAAAAVIVFFTDVLIMLSAITSYYMILSLGNYHRESEELRLFKQQQEFRLESNESVKRQYEETRRIRHDLKQVYAVLSTLLSENKVAEAEEYLSRNYSEIESMEILIDVGNDFINAILSSKLNRAKALGITVRCCVDRSLKFDEADMCVLLGNMLDNAIEACDKCAQPRYVELSIISRGEQYLIEVANSVPDNVLGENAALETTKRNADLHGFGTKSIRQIAEKYDGNVRYFQEGDIFTCEVLLTADEAE